MHHAARRQRHAQRLDARRSGRQGLFEALGGAAHSVNTDFRLNASQPVSLVSDDVVQENPILKSFPVFDISRIEVLARPAGLAV